MHFLYRLTSLAIYKTHILYSLISFISIVLSLIITLLPMVERGDRVSCQWIHNLCLLCFFYCIIKFISFDAGTSWSLLLVFSPLLFTHIEDDLSDLTISIISLSWLRKKQRVLMRIHTIYITWEHLKCFKIIDSPLFLAPLIFTICLRKMPYHLTIDDYNNPWTKLWILRNQMKRVLSTITSERLW